MAIVTYRSRRGARRARPLKPSDRPIAAQTRHAGEIRSGIRLPHCRSVTSSCPSLSYCETKAQRSLISFSFLMPANAILVPGIFAFGSLMYSMECGLVPGDAGILVGVGVGIALGACRTCGHQPVEHRADLVLGAFADRVAGQAFVEARSCRRRRPAPARRMPRPMR